MAKGGEGDKSVQAYSIPVNQKLQKIETTRSTSMQDCTDCDG